MTSLCLCPVSPEFQNLHQFMNHLGFKHEVPDPLDHQFVFFPELSLYLGKAGIGASRFQKNATWYIQKIKPEILICAGGAGALTPEMDIGTVIARSDSQTVAKMVAEKFEILCGSHTIVDVETPVVSIEMAEE